jgi:hypothetical protein
MTAHMHMTGKAQPPSSDRSAKVITEVSLIWIEKRIEHWVRFGHMVGERSIDGQRRMVSFAPGCVFAVVRWQSNDFGTIHSSIDILSAAGRSESYHALPFVRPGGEVLLHVEGGQKVERVLRAIDAIEDIRIDPADVPPDYWRHVQNRLAARLDPRRYTSTRHSAWQQSEGAS